jgi:hypothetical protein
MTIKSTALALLCSLMLMTGTLAQTRQAGERRTSPARIRKSSRRARVRRRAPVATPQLIPAREDAYTQRLTLRGLIISTEGGSFTLRDGRGLDTVVLLFPDTRYRIERATGALRKADPSDVVRPGMKVTVEGLLNSSYRMKANVVTAEGY